MIDPKFAHLIVDDVDKPRACAVVYRVSDRQVGWLYHDDTFVPCVWEKAKSRKGEGIMFTSIPEYKE